MANLLKKLFGSKAERDVKQITPTLKLVLAVFVSGRVGKILKRK